MSHWWSIFYWAAVFGLLRGIAREWMDPDKDRVGTAVSAACILVPVALIGVALAVWT